MIATNPTSQPVVDSNGQEDRNIQFQIHMAFVNSAIPEAISH